MLDLLYAAKCAHARIINHVVALYPQQAGNVVSVRSLIEDFELGLALGDESQIGKMKKAYALQVFTCANAFTELEKGKFASFYFLLIYMLLIDVFGCPHFSLDLRIFLTTSCITCFASNATPVESCLSVEKSNSRDLVHRPNTEEQGCLVLAA